MDFEKFTDRARGMIQAAQTIVLRENQQRLTPEHILKALLDDKEGMAAGLIKAAGGNPATALAEVTAELKKIPSVEGGDGQLYLDPKSAKLFDSAQQIAEKAGDSYVTVERLLLALAMATGTPSADILKRAGVNPQSLNAAIEDIRKGRNADSARLEVVPLTGRSHQIRLHLATLGHPILGDPLYADTAGLAAAPRLCLHATDLSVQHPDDGQPTHWHSPCPF